MNLEVGALTHPCKARPSNEDYLGTCAPRHPHQRASKGAIFAVAEGMDSYRLGSVASRLAVRTLVHEYHRDASFQPADSLRRAVVVANWQVRERARAEALSRSAGTTLVALVVRRRELLVANVGDSGAYLMRGRQIWRLTRDHSWIAEAMAAGALSLRKALKHPWRNVTTRSLGAGPKVEVDIYRYQAQPGDTFLLCSDGLHNRVSAREMWKIANQAKPQKAAQKPISLANRRKGDDNITALVVRLLPEARKVTLPARHLPTAAAQGMPACHLRPSGAHVASIGLYPLAQVMSGLALASLAIFLAMYWLGQA